MRVLLVDDDADQLAIRAMLLEQCGYETVAATTSEAALEAAAREGLSCVVMDLRLPTTQEGIETLRRLRELQPPARIFVLTGMRQQSPELEQAQQYADGVLTKGAGMDNLLNILAELRDRAGLLQT